MSTDKFFTPRRGAGRHLRPLVAGTKGQAMHQPNRLAAMLEADDRRRERQQARMPAAPRVAVFNSLNPQRAHPLWATWAPLIGADGAAFVVAQAERRAHLFQS